MGTSCSRPQTHSPRAKRNSRHNHFKHSDSIKAAASQQTDFPDACSPSPVSGVTAAVVDMSAVAAAVTTPVAKLTPQLSARLLALWDQRGDGDIVGGQRLQRTHSDADSFFSACSELSSVHDFATAHGTTAADMGRCFALQHAALSQSQPSAHHRSRMNAAALLIDSPTVAGPLPEPCASPTFRRLNGGGRSDCSNAASSSSDQYLYAASDAMTAHDSQHAVPGASRPAADPAGDPALEQLCSLSASSIEVRDSATSLRDGATCFVARGGAAKAAGGGMAAAAAAAVLRQSSSARRRASVPECLRLAALAFNEGKVLQAEELAQQAAAAAGCSLEALAECQQSAATPTASSAQGGGSRTDSHADQRALGAEAATGSSLNLQQLLEAAADVRQGLRGLENTRGWTATRDGGLKVLYKHKAGSTVHSCRVEAVYDWPADQLLSVAREFDVVGSFNRFAQDHSVLAEPSVFQSVVYAGTWMPFPMKPLELIISVRWADLVEEEGIILVPLCDFADQLSSVQGAKPLPAKSSSRRRGRLLPGSCGYMRPMPPGPDGLPRTKCVIMAHLDAGIAFIPGFVVSFVLKVLSPFLFNATKRLLRESFASPEADLPRRIAAKPELYGLIRAAEQAALVRATAPGFDARMRTFSVRSDDSQQ